MLKDDKLICPRCAQIITDRKKFEERRHIRGYDTKAKRYRFDIFCTECYPYDIPEGKT